MTSAPKPKLIQLYDAHQSGVPAEYNLGGSLVLRPAFLADATEIRPDSVNFEQISDLFEIRSFNVHEAADVNACFEQVQDGGRTSGDLNIIIIPEFGDNRPGIRTELSRLLDGKMIDPNSTLVIAEGIKDVRGLHEQGFHNVLSRSFVLPKSPAFAPVSAVRQQMRHWISKRMRESSCPA